MALTYGFFDSINKDRTYNADQFSSFLDGIVYDGVYQAVGNKFFVSAYSGMQVTVDTGRAWFDHTWTLNTTKLVLTIPDADTIYSRIDAVVLEINKQDRRNYIKVVKGSPAAYPSNPDLKKTNLVKQYPLAYITVPKLVSSISQSNIRYMVDTQETPLASALALSGIPSGGKIGQVLAKKSSESGAIGWYDMYDLPKSKWYLPTGISESQVLAAYLFGGVANENTALRNVNNGVAYALAKSGNVLWNSQKGFLVNGSGLVNEQLANLYNNMNTIVVCFSDVDISKTNECYLCQVKGADRAVCANNVQSTANETTHTYKGVGFKKDASEGTFTGNICYTGSAYAQGVMAVDFKEMSVYMNGAKLAVSETYNERFPISKDHSFIAGGDGYRTSVSGGDVKSAYIHSIIFYSASLSSDQHVSLANEIRRMRGI